MRRIVILTFAQGANHGQYMQAKGTYVLMKELGFKPYFLWYNNHRLKEIYLHFRSGHLIKYLWMLGTWLVNFRWTFRSRINKFDAVVIGSDMVWNLDSNLFSADPLFFGLGIEKPIICNAPSTATLPEKMPKWLDRRLLSNIAFCGVRDRNTQKLLSHFEIDSELIIDPSFHIKLPQNCTDIYRVGVYAHNVKEVLPILLSYGYKRSEICLIGYTSKGIFDRDYWQHFKSPAAQVDIFSKCRLIITSTFHGTMFALNAGKPFITISSPSVSARLDSPISDTFSRKRLITLENLSQALEDKTLHSASDLKLKEIVEYQHSSKIKLARALDESLPDE